MKYFIKALKNEYAALQRKELIITKRQKTAPLGRIKIKNDKGYLRYYHCIKDKNGDEKEHYISSNDKKKIKSLIQKPLDINSLKHIKRRMQYLKKLIKEYSEDAVIKEFERLSESRKQFATPINFTYEQVSKLWLKEKNEKNPYKHDNYNIVTAKGEYVRSKSEKIIADALYYAGIAYKYEGKVKMRDGKVYFVDFVILCPLTFQEIYWEHLGKYDEENYHFNVMLKLDDYHKNGIRFNKNLIITYEGEKYPLNTAIVDIHINTILGK